MEQSLYTEHNSDVPERMDGGEDNYDFESMTTAEEVATLGIRGKSREVQRVCEDCRKAVPKTIVEVVEVA